MNVARQQARFGDLETGLRVAFDMVLDCASACTDLVPLDDRFVTILHDLTMIVGQLQEARVELGNMVGIYDA